MYPTFATWKLRFASSVGFTSHTRKTRMHSTFVTYPSLFNALLNTEAFIYWLLFPWALLFYVIFQNSLLN